MTAVFDPNRCAHVDGNLWRGNLPFTAAGVYADGELRNVLKVTDTEHYFDVSLIDNVEGSERHDWLAEMAAFDVEWGKYFPQGPNIPPQFNQTEPPYKPGRLFRHDEKPRSIMWWQIEGGEDSIVLGPPPNSYDFIGLMERMGELCERGRPVYVHCQNGTDRTGAVVAAYGLRYLRLTLDEAFKLADSVPAAGTMNEDYRKLVTAYSEQLESA